MSHLFGLLPYLYNQITACYLCNCMSALLEDFRAWVLHEKRILRPSYRKWPARGCLGNRETRLKTRSNLLEQCAPVDWHQAWAHSVNWFHTSSKDDCSVY